LIGKQTWKKKEVQGGVFLGGSTENKGVAKDVKGKSGALQLYYAIGGGGGGGQKKQV